MTMRRRLSAFLIGALVIAAVVGIYYMPQAQQPRQAQGGPKAFQRSGGGPPTEPVPVLATLTKTADVPVYLDGVGTAKALNTVTVRPQVDGKLIKVAFVEGQDVEKGFILAKVDPVTYQAAYDQTVAKKAQDEAQLANAKLDLERYTKLAVTNAVNKQQLDTQKAMVAQLIAQVQLDQAAIDSARATLSYTDVIAPIAGRTGIRQIDEGNIVHAADAGGIVILTQLRPISIFFSLPQQNLPSLNKGFAEGPLPVDALGADGKTPLDRGRVVVIDNQVDQTTGTVKIKGEFPNDNLQLWPGQFVNVRVLMDTLRQVVVVPTAAIQRGPNGTFVYVVKDGKAVTVRPVKLAQQDDARSVIASGLQAGEQVVTTGFARLTEGAPVSVASADDAGQIAPAERARPEAAQSPPPDASRAGRTDGARGTRAGDKGRRSQSNARPPAINP
jgi:membrane fusion protein, multidrug efflux system